MNRLIYLLLAMAISFSSSATIGPILGSPVVCSGSGFYLSDTTAGGLWTSSNTAVVIAGSSSGSVFGVGAGTAVITYTTGAGYVTTTVTVNPAPGPITGTLGLCAGYTSALSDATSGGTWSSSATSVATVNPVSGVVGGISAGYATITYMVGTCYNTVSVTVSGGSIGSLGVLGCNTVGIGDTMPFGSPGPGVGYYTSDPSIVKYATYPRAGIVGVSAGVADINVFSSTGCLLGSVPVTVTPTQMVYPPTGRYQVCAGDTAQMHEIIPGGIWSTSPASAATIDASGLFHAISQWPVWVTYTVAGGLHCTTEVDVISLPTISGPSSVCVGDTIYISGAVSTWWSDVVLGGIYSNSDTSIAKFIWASNFDGRLKGMSPGVDTITYTDVEGPRCSISKIITVAAAPSVGPITGASVVCVGTPAILTDTTLGGVWSSSNVAIATVGSTGVTTGAGTGTASISYSVTYTCGVALATTTVTVNALPVVDGISGGLTICALSSISLSDLTGGGTWSVTDAGIATIDGGGTVTGASSGVDTVKYSVTNSCGVADALAVVTVNPLPDAGSIAGVETVCALSTTTLTDIAAGGTWSISTGIASVGTSGTVTGISEGTAVVSYSVTNICGVAAATATVTVNPLPVVSSISGPSVVCALASMTLSDSVAGGAWSSSDMTIATAGSTGVITGLAPGVDTIRYTVTNVCGVAVSAATVTVNPVPDAGAIIGAMEVCVLSTALLSDIAAGGTWSISTGIASIGTSGDVTGITAGTGEVSYSVTNVCGTAVATAMVTVDPLPDAGVITGAGEVCATAAIVLSDVATGGEWISSATGIAIVATSGVVTGVSSGAAEISYSVTNSCGTVAAVITMTVDPLPDAGVVSGADSLCISDTLSLAETVSGGVWSASNASAFVSGGGIVLGYTPGADTIIYSVTNSCGTGSAAKVIHIFDCTTTGLNNVPVLANEINIYPNPAGTFITITSSSDLGRMLITDLLGQIVLRLQTNERSLQVDVTVLAPGIYFVHSAGSMVKKFVKE